MAAVQIWAQSPLFPRTELAMTDEPIRETGALPPHSPPHSPPIPMQEVPSDDAEIPFEWILGEVTGREWGWR